jgi:hypothetical protein
MSGLPTTCPRCGSTEIHFRKSRGDCSCDNCEHKWTPTAPADSSLLAAPRPKARLFLSYGRRDAEELADRLDQDLSLFGHEDWRDTRQIRSATDFLSGCGNRADACCRDTCQFPSHGPQYEVRPGFRPASASRRW